MRRLSSFLCAFVLILSLTAIAAACPIPFQITGGSLSIEWFGENGPGEPTEGENPDYDWVASSFTLDEDESQHVTFGIVDITPPLLGAGIATFTVEFFLPQEDVVQDNAILLVVSREARIDWTAGFLIFGDPVEVPYSYGGLSGGLMEVDFFDQIGIQQGFDVYITGAVRNLSNPVPEPATMLLLGTGLVGLAGFGRKKFFKKS